MAKKQIAELKVGDKIVLFGEVFKIKKIEFSEKGIKQGRTKARIEAENEKTKETKIIIRLANEQIEVK